MDCATENPRFPPLLQGAFTDRPCWPCPDERGVPRSCSSGAPDAARPVIPAGVMICRHTGWPPPWPTGSRSVLCRAGPRLTAHQGGAVWPQPGQFPAGGLCLKAKSHLTGAGRLTCLSIVPAPCVTIRRHRPAPASQGKRLFVRPAIHPGLPGSGLLLRQDCPVSGGGPNHPCSGSCPTDEPPWLGGLPPEGREPARRQSPPAVPLLPERSFFSQSLTQAVTEWSAASGWPGPAWRSRTVS